MKPDVCIYHGDCDDGFAAACVVRGKRPDVTFVPGFYGKPIAARVTGKNVLFVDFSLKRSELEAMAAEAASIVILDHHKTAEAELAPFRIEACGGATLSAAVVVGMLDDISELGRPRAIAWFDMAKSGARIAWEYCRGPATAAPRFIDLIEDRDLWRFRFGDDTRRFSAALRTYPQDFEVWRRLEARGVDALIREGEAILRGHMKNVGTFCDEASTQSIGGFDVPTVNVPYHYASDVAHELLRRWPGAPFAAAWFLRGDGQIQFSLRSEDAREDVSRIAALFGGGGHRNAAGFQVAADDVPSLLS